MRLDFLKWAGGLETSSPLQSPKAKAHKHPWCELKSEGIEVQLNFSNLELAHEKLFSIFQDILGR
jgi:hypothetical protein